MCLGGTLLFYFMKSTGLSIETEYDIMPRLILFIKEYVIILIASPPFLLPEANKLVGLQGQYFSEYFLCLKTQKSRFSFNCYKSTNTGH